MEIYKNNKRVTLIDGDRFVEVHELKTVVSIRCGKNEFMIDNARKYDVQVTGDDVKDLVKGVLAAFEELILDLKQNVDEIK